MDLTKFALDTYSAGAPDVVSPTRLIWHSDPPFCVEVLPDGTTQAVWTEDTTRWVRPIDPHNFVEEINVMYDGTFSHDPY
jgi:hypothetical protein